MKDAYLPTSICRSPSLRLQAWRVRFSIYGSLTATAKAIVSVRWPLTISALFDAFLLITTTELLQGVIGDIVMTLLRIAVQWASWWVLP